MVIVNSFSMGETSALMSMMLPKWYPEAKIISVTANTGQESMQSVQFGKNVDRFLGLNAALVEAVVNPAPRKGTTHKLVGWDDAYFGMDIWDAVVRKFGIFNIQYLHCTREMKERPIRSYLRSLGLRPRDYKIAVGIRADEAERVKNPNPQFLYPLLERGLTKEDAKDGISDWPFKLGIQTREGNCLACPKKSLKKTLINLQENPGVFDEIERIEGEHAMTKQRIQEPRRFFREKLTVSDLRSRLNAIGRIDPRLDNNEKETGCAQHCLPFAR